MTLPKMEKITAFEDAQVKQLNDTIEKIEDRALSVQYGEDVPTKLDYGVLYIRDNGATRGVYVKTGKGEIIAI